MTNDQINRAIAEACGWKPKRQTKLTRMGFRVSYENTPNYCEDLNAMHEAEKTIYKHHNLWSAYYYHVGAGAQGLHATARKKAEAFPRTLGKWEEVQP